MSSADSADERKKGAGQSGQDFRYDTGAARVPWAAVGEGFGCDDVLALVRFLLPPVEGEASYEARLARIEQEVRALGSCSTPAGKLTLGDQVKQAEAAVRERLGVAHAVLLANWTGGMEIAYKLSGLGPGDEVIMPAITFVACMAYPLAIGAKVVFADVDPQTLTLDAADVARKLTSRTRVIMPVHIGGYPADMDPLMALAAKHDVFVVEDAAHALGATYKGRFAGTIGHFGGYSLHEVKNVNSLGEGGLLVSNSPLGEQFSRARFLGLDFSRQIENWLYDISPLVDRFGRPQVPGNHSVTEIQALAFLLQLARLDAIIESRRRVFERLNERFSVEDAILPPPPDTDGTRSTHHLYLLQIDPQRAGGNVQRLRAKLKARGVTEIPHFGPMYRFRILRELGYDGAAIAETCPSTEYVFNERFTHLPLYGLAGDQVEYMADAVLESVREMKRGA